MIVVCDVGPLHYLVLIGAEHVLPQLFTRVLTPPVVLVEMSRYVGDRARVVIEDMKQRDLQRKQDRQT
jgi:predicted nucleic acid-binding protein